MRIGIKTDAGDVSVKVNDISTLSTREPGPDGDHNELLPVVERLLANSVDHLMVALANKSVRPVALPARPDPDTRSVLEILQAF